MLKYMVGVGRIESVDLTVFVYPDSFLYTVVLNPFSFRYIDDVGREVRLNGAHPGSRVGFFITVPLKLKSCGFRWVSYKYTYPDTGNNKETTT